MKTLAFIPVLMLMIGALACSFSFSTASIDNEALARDSAGRDKTDIFDVDETVYAVLDLKNAPEDTTIQAIWYVVEVDGIEPNTELGRSDELEASSAEVWFSFFPDSGWVPGAYKVELILNTTLDKTLSFTVQDLPDTITDTVE